MAVHIFKEGSSNLDEHLINDSYAMYLHKFIGNCSKEISSNNLEACAIMSHDEFKEYYILNILGRTSEFTANIARDYQYLSFDNLTQTAV